MAQDYMPKSFGNSKSWLTNLKERISEDGPDCEQSPAQVAEDIALVDSILTPVTEALAKQGEWIAADGTAHKVVRDQMPSLRKMINRYKASNGWNDGMAETWKVKTHSTSYDLSTHKPHLTAQSRLHMTEISGSKPGFSAVDVQMRLEGASDWATIGMKIHHFPFFDTTAPQTPGKPEKREYRALGYDGDKQVGQPSDIASAVFNS